MSEINKIKSNQKAGKLLIVVLIILLVILAITKINDFSKNFSPYISAAWNFIKSDKELLGSDHGKTNILILGKGGGGHEAPELTDSIMIASLDEGGVKLVSIPRDLWIDDLKTKINSLYYYGKNRSGETGIGFAGSEMQKLLGIPIHHVLVLDFESFIQTIDVLGGVDVDVANAFTDYKYPLKGKENDSCDGDLELSCRYETVSFASGTQHMNGDTALKFVRSRNSEGDEGTDLARSTRQQLIFTAIIKKFMSFETLSSKEKVEGVWQTINSSIETDMDINQLGVLARVLYDNKDRIEPYTIPQDLLLNPPLSNDYGYLYVFIPSGSWDEVRNWIDETIN